MKCKCIAIVLLYTSSYAWGTIKKPPSIIDNVILSLNSQMIGKAVPSDGKITLNNNNTFIQSELVAIKSNNGAPRYGMIQAKSQKCK